MSNFLGLILLGLLLAQSLIQAVVFLKITRENKRSSIFRAQMRQIGSKFNTFCIDLNRLRDESEYLVSGNVQILNYVHRLAANQTLCVTKINELSALQCAVSWFEFEEGVSELFVVVGGECLQEIKRNGEATYPPGIAIVPEESFLQKEKLDFTVPENSCAIGLSFHNSVVDEQFRPMIDSIGTFEHVISAMRQEVKSNKFTGGVEN